MNKIKFLTIIVFIISLQVTAFEPPVGTGWLVNRLRSKPATPKFDPKSCEISPDQPDRKPRPECVDMCNKICSEAGTPGGMMHNKMLPKITIYGCPCP